ncbi:MAG: hypothetical protein GWN58_17975, partial [Anaerolineae bacterium]|nr:hypothetical protein [Anaerolineae bacterium]
EAHDTMLDLMRRADVENLSEPGAFAVAIELEQSLVEQYLQAVLKMTTDSPTLARLQAVSSQEEEHHELLEQEYER